LIKSERHKKKAVHMHRFFFVSLRFNQKLNYFV